MRRFTAALVAVMLLFSMTAYGVEMNLIYDDVYHYYNVDDISLEINGRKIVTKEMPPIILMDRTLVPVREVFESIGGQVSWLNETKQTKISYRGNEVLFTTGSRTIYLGKSKIMIPAEDPAPMIINDKTMVPIRIVADLLGFEVSWHNSTRTVTLIDSDEGVAPIPDENKPAADEKPKAGDITKIFCTVNGGTDLVYLAYTDPAKPTISRYNSPDRVVLDFDGAVLKNVSPTISFSDGSIINSVRSANHDDRARIVLDVKKQPNIEVCRSATGIVIVAGPSGSKYTTKIGDLKNGAIYEPPKISPGSDNSQPSDTKPDNPPEKDPDENTPVKPDETQKPGDQVDLDTSGTVDTTNTNSFDYNSIVIDPGHGGTDPGAIGESVKEKDIALAISRKVMDKLKDEGYKVVMTRTGDTYPTLQDRVDIASKKTNGKIPALYVSIHCNSFENPASNGTQVYYHPDSKYGTILAENIYNSNVENTSLKAAQIHDGSHLFVIRKTIQPAALVETAFISNESDRRYLSSEEGQEALAQGIFEGIVKTMEQMKSDKGIE